MTTFEFSTWEGNAEEGVESHYQYESLCEDRREFRLLDVHPAEPTDTLVRCSLRQATLEDERIPAYETISYVWGKETNLNTIDLDGRTYKFPATSIAAIRRVRSPHALRTLWIDAVCIDQGNLKERAQQVEMMGQIYRRSAGNLIYFGHCLDENSTQLALRDIRRILQEMTEDTQSLNEVAGTTKAGSSLRCSVDCDRLIECLYSLPWFSRLWVVQEAALAPLNTCLLGPFQFDLLDVLRAAKWLRYKEPYMPPGVVLSIGHKNASILWDLVDRRHGYWSKKEIMVSSMLEKSRDFDTSVRVDRVYAMLGLKRWPGRIPLLLQPDYNRPYHEVVRDAVRFALQEYDNGLWLWKNISFTSDEELKKPDSLTWVLKLERWDPAFHPVVFCHHLFSCAKAQPQPWPGPRPGCNVDLDVLEISGFILCTVEHTAPELTQEIWDDAERRSAWVKACDGLVQAQKDDFNAAALLIGGVNAENSPATPDDCDAWEDLKSALLKEDRREATSMDLGPASARFEFALLNVCRWRRVFRTAKGYMGVGSKITARGDVVAMIYGAYMPYILRPTTDGKYRLLGECYIQSDDVMFGQEMKALQQRHVHNVVYRIV